MNISYIIILILVVHYYKSIFLCRPFLLDKILICIHLQLSKLWSVYVTPMASLFFEGYCAITVHVMLRYSSVLCEESAQHQWVRLREKAVFSSVPHVSKSLVWPKYQNLQEILSRFSCLTHLL